ncbi:hypothetical protein QZM82_06545 [Burkholderia cepacia]|uniref:hypothetical protein n=1 Tax=Burkholderia cepacia TaxID=292 RepID=UPI0026519BBA|nr:hypothetical protein [Burkholderia cepacia]MDN7895852.1 hypothetical protein [Burkholderia cepacia]
MKKPTPRPQPAPLSYGASTMRTEGIWRAVKNFLAFSERGNVNPMSTKETPRTAVTTRRRISDRQVEIMTATLCDVVANEKLPPDEAQALVGELIGAMVKQATRLNEVVEAANNPVGFDVKVTINNVGRPVVESDEDRAAAFGRLAGRGDVNPGSVRDCGPQSGFAITKDWDVLDISASMAGRRLVAVVLFGDEDFALVERITRARLVAKQGDPALRDCLRDAVRKCRESRRLQGELP